MGKKKLIYIGYNSSVFSSQVIDLLNEIAKYDYKVYLITNYKGYLKNKKVKKYILKLYPDYPLITQLTYRQLYKIFKDIGIDRYTIVHVRYDVVGVNVYRFLNKKYPEFSNLLVDARAALYEEIEEYYNFNPILKKIKLHYLKSLRKYYPKIQYWSAVSNEMKNYIVKLNNNSNYVYKNPSLAGKKFRYDEEQRELIRNKLNISKYVKLIVFSSVGSTKWNNIDQIIDYFSNFGNKVKFLILTNKKYKNNKNLINMYVPYEYMYKYLSAADIGIILRDESIVNNVASPVKFSEYVCCGLPVIANKNVCMINNFISNDISGKLIDDISDIDEKVMDDLIKLNRKKIAKLGKMEFGCSHIVKNYLEIYNNIFEHDKN